MQRAADLPEGFLFHMEVDIDLIVILVDSIEKRPRAREYASVNAACRIPGLPSEKVVRLFTECPTTIDEFRA